LTIQQLKLTRLGDTKTNVIVDLHVTTTGKHDSQIVPSLIDRTASGVSILRGDKGYDDRRVRVIPKWIHPDRVQ